MTALHKWGASPKVVTISKRGKIKALSLLLAVVLVVSFFALLPQEDNVAHASNAVFWVHKGKTDITNISSGEIGRFYNGDPSTEPALYDDSWGNFVLGGINRVDKESLPVSRPSDIEGTGVMDSYESYITQNVSVVRYKGGADSNLGISVNSEEKGYIKMDVGDLSGRYLYYSVSVESLTGDDDSAFGTFGFDVEGALIARTENNKCGGVAYITDGFETYSDKENWVSGYEYGCIDLKALTGNDSHTVSTVYLWGNSKTKVVLNYLVMSDTHPTKVDAASGNILAVGTAEGADSDPTIERTYPDAGGSMGTGTLALSGAPAFSFENLVIDTEYTPYLYYSFTVGDANSAFLKFFEGASSYYVAKNGSNTALTSVTGCIKMDTLLGKEGIINISDNADRARSFTFGEISNLTVNYLFFYSGVDVSKGDHIIVKNADAYNVYNPDGSFLDYEVTDFSDGSLNAARTYRYKTNEDMSTGVWAPFTHEIDTNFNVDFCWYVNSTESMVNAKRIGRPSTAVDEVALSLNSGIVVRASVEVTKSTGKIETTLKVLNPSKDQNGLYFFCLAVAAVEDGEYDFKETLTGEAVAEVDNHWNASGNLCRLDVANNLVYHSVDKSGTEIGVIGEDWIVYGTDCKIKDEVEFEEIGGYVKYNVYTAPTETDGPSFEREENKTLVLLSEGDYSLRSYEYSQIQDGVTGVNFNGWMLFADTVKNPNSARSKGEYISIYEAYYRNTDVVYDNESSHRHWTFPVPYSFSLHGGLETDVHDTTLNLYTKWEIPVEAENLQVLILVDEFGTTFTAKETEDGYKMIGANEKPTGENTFINDVVYIAVAPKTDGTSETISGGNGTLQYTVDNGVTWIDVGDAASALNGKYTEEYDMTVVKTWFTENTEYSYDLIYAIKMDTDDILKAFGKTDGISGPKAEFKITFRYIAGINNEDGWFDFNGKAVCGSLRFVPFKYIDLT